MKAATPKAGAPAKSVNDYLASVSEDARVALEKVRSAIKMAAPEATETVSYGVPMFKHNDVPLVSFGVAKSHCSFYVMSPKVMETHASDLKGYDLSKGTIRFPINKPLPAALVKKLVKARIAENDTREKQKQTKPAINNATSTTKGQVFDSPTGWVRDHIQAYVESDGKKGHRWRGYPTLLLTTRGRKTGKLRRTALIYGQDGKHYLLVASNGGAPDHPSWYLNLAENPEVELQVGADTFVARARIASPKEKPRLWQVMTTVFPTYDTYQTKAAKAGRDIPLVIVEPD